MTTKELAEYVAAVPPAKSPGVTSTTALNNVSAGRENISEPFRSGP